MTDDKNKTNVYSKLSYIQNRKYPQRFQISEPIEGKEKIIKHLDKRFQKAVSVSIDDLIKENDDMEDDVQGLKNVVEFHIQTLSQQIYQTLYANEIIDQVSNQKNIDQQYIDLQKEIDYVHSDYIIYILKQKFRNLLSNQFNKVVVLQLQYTIYLLYLILFKNNVIEELQYSDKVFVLLKNSLSPTLKELCNRIFDKQFVIDEEIKKFETFIGDVIKNIDQKILIAQEDELETEVEDGEPSEI